MKRKMIRFARGAKWGCLGASGCSLAWAVVGDAEPSMAAKATEAKPPPLRFSISRRVEIGSNWKQAIVFTRKTESDLKPEWHAQQLRGI
jgi:hypothetical protein